MPPTTRSSLLGIGLVALASAFAPLPMSAQRRPPPPTKAPVKVPQKATSDSAAKADSVARADSVAMEAEAERASAAFASMAGTVYDSLHAQPLGDATVSIEGTNRVGVTTRLGIFLLDSIPPGTHQLRVQHVLLDSLGIVMLTAPFELKAGDSPTLQLGIPASASLVEVSCPAARRALGPSAVIGRLLDADTELPVEGARVSIAWLEMSINAGLRKVPRLREALSGADGVFRICGLPPTFEGTLQATRKGIATSEVRIVFEGQPLVVQGLKIGNNNTVVRLDSDTAAARRQKEASAGPQFSAARLQTGNASLTGKVVNANDQPVVGARVDVLGTPGAALTKENGEFTLHDLPSGTQSVVVRQIGYAPEEVAVELSTREVARVDVKMARPAAVLSTVVVKADRDVGLERVGFTQRERSGGGYYITADDISKRGPNLLTDVFRTVPGLRVTPAGNGTDYVIESSRSATGGCVRYFVDGAVFEAVFPGDVDRLVPPWEVAAIEVYNGISVPGQFQAAGNSSCAAVVIWTKTRVDKPGRR
ncbi:MAG: carboxypeptidase regulatory-like domain-containing protein [Gemmatimonadaceae bacterium]